MRYVRSASPEARRTGCRYCGTQAVVYRDDERRRACLPTVCLACGVRTCMGYGPKCPACFVGLLAGWADSDGPCMGANGRCRSPRVMHTGRRQRYLCRRHGGIDVEDTRQRTTSGQDIARTLILYLVTDEQERVTRASVPVADCPCRSFFEAEPNGADSRDGHHVKCPLPFGEIRG